ncbi:MOCOS-like protein [Mya arenaria]|uniref:MOCOS-like protein n=1 Tax=Mya arenaria TaxID=6604 RepID=A0ABY7E7U8_MYAAR|nr:MOCOS-like protein [Mya arenaria]
MAWIHCSSFSQVDKLAQLYSIHLRTGCFCNMGACQKYLRLTDTQIRENFDAGHVCGDDKDLLDGRPTGAVRVSFGYMSTLEDAQKCLQFIVDCFMERTDKPVYWSGEI